LMRQWKPVCLLLLTVGLAASGCAGSLRELKQVASQQHSCPVEKIDTILHEGYVAMLDVCGTYRRYLYQGLHAAGQLFPPHSWQEVEIGYNKFDQDEEQREWLYDMWGTSASNIWAVGTRGALFHFDGRAWESLPCEGRPIHHFGVWGAGANAVWVVGSEGKVLRWDGKGWTCEQLPTSTTLIGVHGTSRHDLWIVGRKGLIVHWDGAEWKPVESGVKRDLYRVWAVRPDLAWAVGDTGTLLRWDGRRWAKQDLGTVSPLMTIWARSAKDVWVGALNGQVFRWNGRQWTPVNVFSIEDMKHPHPCVEKILGFGSDDVWVMGCQIHHYDGRVWRRLDWDPVAERKLAGSGPGSWGSSSTDVYAVTSWEQDRGRLYTKGSIERKYDHWNGRTWRERSWSVNRCK
jgi:hypothetical protein